MHKLLRTIIILFLILNSYFLILSRSAFADTSTDNALNFLKSKQDSLGRITTGFSAPSQWSAIAFTINSIDIATIKNPTTSLKDFLSTDIPSEPSNATDWENRILAIVAIGEDPTNVNGTNFVTHLQTFANNNQIGDTCSLNDDIFGLLALIASGPAADTQIKQNTLDFLISKQDSTDGGFGFSAPGCDWYSTSADMTGAAIQALVAARDHGLINPGLDDAISKAKNYLLTNQDTDGGFGYFGSSDSDTTGWVIQAFNVLDLQDSQAATQAKNWLLSQQSQTDGGFTAFDYGTNTFVSNATTTAQALIALAGKGWVIKIFDPSQITPTPTDSITPTPTPGSNSNNSNPTPTPTPGSSSSSPTNTPTPTPVLTNTPTPTIISHNTTAITDTPTPTTEEITPTQAVLGATDTNKPSNTTIVASSHISPFVYWFLGIGTLSLLVYFVQMFYNYQYKKN